MWDEVLRLVMSNGIWAVLFCGLLYFQLKDSRIREEKYRAVIDKLMTSLSCVHLIGEKVEQIDENVRFILQTKIKAASKRESAKELKE